MHFLLSHDKYRQLNLRICVIGVDLPQILAWGKANTLIDIFRGKTKERATVRLSFCFRLEKGSPSPSLVDFLESNSAYSRNHRFLHLFSRVRKKVPREWKPRNGGDFSAFHRSDHHHLIEGKDTFCDKNVLESSRVVAEGRREGLGERNPPRWPWLLPFLPSG